MRPVSSIELSLSPLAHVGGQEWQTQANVFDELFTLFLVLGTLVGVVVIAYMLHKAYKYREGRDTDDAEIERPSLGELPVGADKGGKKVFVSFTISAVIVVSLVAFAYTSLLYVEAGPTEELGEEDVVEIDVTAYQFGWTFEYPNGETTANTLRVPEGKAIDLTVTSRDVWHTFSVRDLRVKADAMPGQTAEEWFIANETGNHTSVCEELCGSSHSAMNGEVIVMEEEEFLDWYQEELDGNSSSLYGGEIDQVGGLQPSEGIQGDDSDEGDVNETGGGAADTDSNSTDSDETGSNETEQEAR